MLYIAYNCALESASAGITAGTNYTTGAKVAVQLGIPSGGQIALWGWGASFDEDVTANAAANNALFAIRSTATSSTVTTAHSTTTVKPWLDPNAAASRMTMSTTGTGYGSGAITSATTLRQADRRYLPQTGSVDIMFPSDRLPVFGATGAAEFVQLLVNTSATVNMLCYLLWEERI